MHEGGCVCGAVRYRVKNARVYFRKDDFELLRGKPSSYEHRWIERHTWARSKQHWVPIPADMEKHEKSAIK